MKKILFLLCLIAMVSCKKTVVASEIRKDFADKQWLATDVKTFNLKIKRDIDNADIKILFSHVYEPQYESVPLEISIESPSGEKDEIVVNLQLKDEDGNDLSDCSGDICDLHTVVKEGVSLKKGIYKISVTNKFAYEYLANVLAVGASIEREE